MSEDNAILIKMAREIGEIHGSLDSNLKSQNKINEALFDICEKQDEKIDKLIAVKNKAIGASLLGGGVGAGIVATIINFFTTGGSH